MVDPASNNADAPPTDADTELACTRCGHSLAGVSGSGSCPECGQSIALSREIWRRAGSTRDGFKRLAGHLLLAAPLAGTLAAAWFVQTLMLQEVLGSSRPRPVPDGIWISPIGASLVSGLWLVFLFLNLVSVVLWHRIIREPAFPKLPPPSHRHWLHRSGGSSGP